MFHQAGLAHWAEPHRPGVVRGLLPVDGRLAGREDLSGRRVFRYFQLWRPGRARPVVRGLPDQRLEKRPRRRDLLAEQRFVPLILPKVGSIDW